MSKRKSEPADVRPSLAEVLAAPGRYLCASISGYQTVVVAPPGRASSTDIRDDLVLRPGRSVVVPSYYIDDTGDVSEHLSRAYAKIPELRLYRSDVRPEHVSDFDTSLPDDLEGVSQYRRAMALEEIVRSDWGPRAQSLVNKDPIVGDRAGGGFTPLQRLSLLEHDLLPWLRCCFVYESRARARREVLDAITARVEQIAAEIREYRSAQTPVAWLKGEGVEYHERY